MLFSPLLLLIFSAASSAVHSSIPQISIKNLLCARFDTGCLEYSVKQKHMFSALSELVWSTILMREMDIIE